MSQTAKIMIAAALLALSACMEIPRTPEQLVCTTDGAETYRSPVSHWIYQRSGKDSWEFSDGSYMPRPGEYCKVEEVAP